MAMVGNIFDVETPVQIVGVKDSWIMAIKFNRPEIEPFAHAYIKGGGHLDPPAVDEKLVIAMEDKEICFHHAPQFLGHQIVPDVSKQEP